MNISNRSLLLQLFLCLGLTAGVWGQDASDRAATPTPTPSPAASPAPTPQVTGKNPIIVIPGLTGSELFNKNTGKQVWFTRSRAKDDDIRLPITPNIAANVDSLVPGDIIRSVKIAKLIPEVEIYEKLIDSLYKRAGYREVKWDEATKDDAQDTYFVFAYDWRRDNVETARLLIRRIAELKAKLGKPDLKFNVVAHSMGGLVTRYAAMYGDSDIGGGKPRPNWAGAKHFDKIFLLGTPNEGSVSSLKALLDGYSYFGGGINLPFFRDISNFDVFTIPSAYQLLPHEGTLQAYGADLKPITLDLYDPKTWEKYGWDVWNGEKFRKRFTPAEQNNALPYFRAVLQRAKRFQEALNANTSATVPVRFYLMGSDCKETQNGMLIRGNGDDKWSAQFNADSYTAADGTKVTSEMLKPLLYSVGDAVVTKRSLTASTIAGNGNPNVLPLAGELIQCETHGRLVTNPDIQDKLFTILGAVPTP
jgi:pimeloyl-ACP methyl ester carboxylesterase